MTQKRKEELSGILDLAFSGEEWDNTGANTGDCYAALKEEVTVEELEELEANGGALLDEIRMMEE